MGNTLRSAAGGIAVLALLHSAPVLAQQQQWGQPAPAQQGWGQQPPTQQWGQPQTQPAPGWGQQQAPPPQNGWGTDATAQAQPDQGAATPPPQPPSPPPPPVTEPTVTSETDEPVTTGAEGGWFVRARLPSAFPLGFVPHAGPQLELGLVLDKLQIHLGLAVTTGSLSQEYVDEGENYTDGASAFALIAAPGVSYVTFRSADRRARMLVQGRALIGTLSTSVDGGRSESAIAYGLSVSGLGEYRVHKAFGTGIEAGYGLAFVTNSGRSSSTSGSMTGLFVAFTGTLYLGG